MRKVMLTVLLAVMFSLSGCLSQVSVKWGDGDGEVSYDNTTNTLSSGLADQQTTHVLNLTGCEDGSLGIGSSQTLTFSGYLAESILYQQHTAEARNVATGIPAAVVIEQMTYEEAEAVAEGEGARIPVSSWNNPLAPETSKGTVDLDSIDDEAESEFFVLGLIPNTDNVLKGFSMLQKTHQAITIEGYLVRDFEGNSGYDLHPGNLEASNCAVQVGDQNRENLFVVVTEITSENGVVSSDGRAKGEWNLGQMPFLGRNGFLLFTLATIVGGGGAAFMFSNKQVVTGADNRARVLLGEEGMIASARAKAKAAAGRVSSQSQPEPQREQAPAPKKPEKKKKQEEEKPPKSSFDIDAALSSSSSSSKGPSRQKSSSVVASEESQKMDQQISSQQETRVFSSEPRRSSSVVSNTAQSQQSNQQTSQGHFSSMSSGNKAPPASMKSEPKKKVRKTRSVKKAATTPEQKTEPVPQPAGNTEKFWEAEEEEFEDFSL